MVHMFKKFALGGLKAFSPNMIIVFVNTCEEGIYMYMLATSDSFLGRKQLPTYIHNPVVSLPWLCEPPCVMYKLWQPQTSGSILQHV